MGFISKGTEAGTDTLWWFYQQVNELFVISPLWKEGAASITRTLDAAEREDGGVVWVAPKCLFRSPHWLAWALSPEMSWFKVFHRTVERLRHVSSAKDRKIASKHWRSKYLTSDKLSCWTVWSVLTLIQANSCESALVLRLPAARQIYVNQVRRAWYYASVSPTILHFFLMDSNLSMELLRPAFNTCCSSYLLAAKQI